MMTCDVPEVFVSIKVILATSSTRRISSDVAFIFPLYLLHRFYSVRVEMSKPTSVFHNRMFEGGPVGYTEGWEKVAPLPNKRSVERSPEKGPNPNGRRITKGINTKGIVRGDLFASSMSPNGSAPRTPSPRTHNHKTPNTPRKQPTKRRFAPPKTPRSTRRRR